MKAGCHSARDALARQSCWTRCKRERLNRGGSPPRAGGPAETIQASQPPSALCDVLLKKILLLRRVLNIHGSLHSDPLEKYLSVGTGRRASDAVPPRLPGCCGMPHASDPAVLSGMLLCAPRGSLPQRGNRGVEGCSALFWGSERRWGGREAALGVTVWQNCLSSGSAAKK